MTKTKTTKDKTKPIASDKAAPPPDGGWRETVESVAMAVILALLFRGFVAEAFVIPTGSMAPTLDGRHKDLKCPQCGAWFQATCSNEQNQDGSLTGKHVINGTCSICRYTQRLNPLAHPNQGSFSGDRIIVGKFCYDLTEPKRWDVIVFKPPGNESTNYIKRLIGLPGEKVIIMGGNIYTCDKDEPNEPDGSPPRAARIARKPPPKLNALLQIVDDSEHIPAELTKLGWPSRWQNWPAENGAPGWKIEDGGRAFSIGANDGEHWLRYRHLVPSYEDWRFVDEVKALPPGVAERAGELIADYYAYNTTSDEWIMGERVGLWRFPLPKAYRPPAEIPRDGPLGDRPHPETLGMHWVDDLAVECLAEVTSHEGQLSLMLVRGGRKHSCRIDLTSGEAMLSMTDAAGREIEFVGDDAQTAGSPKATTTVKGPGRYRLRLSNCDHEMLLWVNGSVVSFNGPTTYASDDLIAPTSSSAEPGDLAPAGIAASGADVTLKQLRIYRDKYYIAITEADMQYVATDYTLPRSGDQVREIFRDPSRWTDDRGLFGPQSRRHVQFLLNENQFFPMGDNSPYSLDARYWGVKRPNDDFYQPHHYVERDLLIGKALVIYWPHTWNVPIPFLPKVTRMGPIR